MGRVKYELIYDELKKKIEALEYNFQELLPSENTLIVTYECSRNTIRRAIAKLVTDGYVQSLQGKGVRVIYEPTQQNSFTLAGIETFEELAKRNGKIPSTKVLIFTELIADARIHLRTGLPIGSELYYIQRIRYLDGTPTILDHSFFLKDVANGLTAEIAEQSIYRYLEQDLGVSIITSKRKITVEKATEIDTIHLALDVNDYNCLAVVSNQTYNSDGVMFEFTASRHRPEFFSFQDTATRTKPTF